jgi:hypothetical protein
MKVWNLVVLTAGIAWAGSASALDFGVMESATPIEANALKLTGYPIAIRNNDRAGDDGGFVFGAGYGLFHGFDVEGTIARYDNATAYGSDVEWQPWRNEYVAVSFGGGGHFIDVEGGNGDVRGLDTTGMLTWLATPRLELNGAIDISVEDVDVPAGRLEDDRYETIYFAPGVTFRLLHDLELIGEVGLGLNNAARDYAGAGVSWYFR